MPPPGFVKPASVEIPRNSYTCARVHGSEELSALPTNVVLVVVPAVAPIAESSETNIWYSIWYSKRAILNLAQLQRGLVLGLFR